MICENCRPICNGIYNQKYKFNLTCAGESITGVTFLARALAAVVCISARGE